MQKDGDDVFETIAIALSDIILLLYRHQISL